jgi:hypothetical protein
MFCPKLFRHLTVSLGFQYTLPDLSVNQAKVVLLVVCFLGGYFKSCIYCLMRVKKSRLLFRRRLLVTISRYF